ncbi:efflux transporter, outer membrane factor (OMF) lipoprotein, NodT family [Flavobacterium glycines]|uniref:Efflux transporter, outer membrane factor (OMF) lipoprotein, NodT family n=1 Tax=Flavobacterium glycines TaxID=551990 RepID=A0A1B9DHJ6_9FLAO|nr:TolC family protein [Flavobacterium glycines]OCB69192.1 RND transporter [Flavobacterium glycines]GEL11871.1 RND transporter [Flavobacterium glycines]SDJ58631.1 efflux transporter, outer membrane factor (OMF) lipoprotein, NodT family [Flavobacterium glycines]
MKKYITKIVMVAILISTIISCKVSKDIETPKDAFPEKFRSASVSKDTASIGDLEWKNFFAEKDIVQLIDSAVTRNNDLQIATKNIEIAQYRFSQSKWGNVPQANLFVNASINRPSENSFTGMNLNQALGIKHIEDYSAGVSLSWEADIWRKIKSQKKGAFATYLQSEEVKKALQTNIVANVSKGYYNLLMLDAQLEIAKKNVQLNDSTTNIIKLKYDSGQVSSLAVQQSEAQKLTAAQLVPLLEQNIAIQENALSVLTGSFLNAKKRSIVLSAIELKNNNSIGIPSSLVSRRPDVKSAELALKVANANVGITKADLYPALRITAQGGLNSFETSSWFNIPASLFGTAVGGLTQPLLNSKKLRTQYNIAKVEREKAVLSFRQTVLVAVSEVSDALVKVEKLEQQQAFLQQRVKTLQQAIKNSNLLFKNGMAEYLEVITAQANLLQSELELANLKREQLAANTDLYRALGGGWR